MLVYCVQTAASCKAKGAPACDTHGVDLSQMSQVRKFTADVLAKHKSVDVLVNNAGMGAKSGAGPIKGMPPPVPTLVKLEGLPAFWFCIQADTSMAHPLHASIRICNSPGIAVLVVLLLMHAEYKS